jgi:hypothetical protein
LNSVDLFKVGFLGKLHAICDDFESSVRLFLTAGNVDDTVGDGNLVKIIPALVKNFPAAGYLLAGNG